MWVLAMSCCRLPSIALVTTTGGAFLLDHIVLALVFGSGAGLVQAAGLAAIVAGMIALTMGALAATEDVRQVQPVERLDQNVPNIRSGCTVVSRALSDPVREALNRLMSSTQMRGPSPCV